MSDNTMTPERIEEIRRELAYLTQRRPHPERLYGQLAMWAREYGIELLDCIDLSWSDESRLTLDKEAAEEEVERQAGVISDQQTRIASLTADLDGCMADCKRQAGEIAALKANWSASIQARHELAEQLGIVESGRDRLQARLDALPGKIPLVMDDIEKQCFVCSEVEGIELGEQRSWVAMAHMVQAATRKIRSLVDAEGKKEGT
jgi:predicted nuclease with TOPRIM domain